MNYFKTHKIIALFLAVLMILPMIPAVDLTVFAEGTMAVTTESLQDDIGRVATINPDVNLFGVYKNASFEGNTVTVFEDGQDSFTTPDPQYYSLDIEFLIEDVYVSDVAIFYKVSVLKQGILTPDIFNDYPWLVQRYVDMEGDTLILGDKYVPDAPVIPEGTVSITDANGNEISTLAMNKYDKPVLKATSSQGANTRYAWQIEYDADKWVNIYGENDASIKVTYGMVATLLEGGSVNIRCKSWSGTKVAYSPSIPVYVYETETNSFSIPRTFADETPGSTSSGVKHNFIVKYYLRDTSEEIYQQFIAEFAPGETRTLKINIPEKVGYTAYWCDASTGNETEVTDYSMEYTYAFTGSEDVTYEVRYVPNQVKYKVKHYFQNITDDGYAAPVIETKTGTADTVIDDVHKTESGFYHIPYIHPTIAPEESTVIEIYYDRYYQLMTFDLGEGGFGVEPVYAKVGTEITLATPERPGYIFNGWEYENGTDITSATITMPAEDVNIVAKWTVGTAKYTIVYWKENATPEVDGIYGYSYWTHRQVSNSKPGAVVSGSDDVAAYVDDETYFTFNSARTDKNVVVRGDGTTVVNVYYTRNSYTLYFYADGDCGIPVHTHGTNCNSYLICGKSEHTHSEACGEPIIGCGVEEHTAHTVDCIDCGEVEHTVHTAICLTCTIPTSHTHSSTCCSMTEHQHSDDCCRWGGTHILHWQHDDDCCKKNLTQHSHGDGDCTCTIPTSHTHSEQAGCYKDSLHTHSDSCYGDELHTHSNACYTYPDCNGAVVHAHTDACYSKCTLIQHTHGNNCPSNNSGNVVKVITAKYEADISAEWPVRGDACLADQNNFYGWQKSGVSTTMVSKRPIMTADLCNTSASSNIMTINVKTEWNTSDVDLNVWFESTDQTTTTTSSTRKLYNNGKYYDLSTAYSQPLKRASGEFSAKEIMGMEDGVVIAGKNSGDVTIHYDRLRYLVTFVNADGKTVQSYNSVMFEYPVKNLTYNENGVTKSVSTLVPAYPDDFESNAYEFKGWYTTPECFDGTEFNFETGVVPNDDLALYAKWAPVTHTVKIYLDDTLSTQIGSTQKILHNEYAMKPANTPTNGTQDFIGWFYKDEKGEEKAFVFTMQVKRDMNIYAKWRDSSIINYEIHYIGIDGSGNRFQLAAPTYGQQYADKTMTFEPKGTDQYFAQYQADGYFAMTPNHSITMGESCDANNPNCVWNETTKTHIFTFYYELGPVVPYTVRYYYEGTTTPVFKNSDGSEYYDYYEDNRKSVVVAYAKGAVGYKSDEVQKSLVVIKGGTNEIIFYYSKDENATYYEVIHHLMDKNGNEITRHTLAYNASVGEKVEVTSATVAPMDFDGFEFDEDYPGTLRSGFATKDPILQLHLYYVEDQVTLKYEVVGGETGGGKINRTEETLGAVSGEAQGSTATADEDYDFVGWYSHWDCTEDQLLSTNQSWVPTKADTALWIDGTTYYAKFKKKLLITYVVIGPYGCGSVSPESETFSMVNPSIPGSTPTANPGYEFVGWYLDEACQNPVTLESDGYVDSATNKLVPFITKIQEMVNPTFYAKFVEIEVTINYVAVGPNKDTINFGEVAPEKNENVKVLTGTPSSAADPEEPVFKFVGWYLDDACAKPVPSDWVIGAQINPGKTKDYGNGVMGFESATYYAKFEYNLTSLTITKKTGSRKDPNAAFSVDNFLVESYDIDKNQTFIYSVTGGGVDLKVTVHGNGDSVTIDGLTVGVEYTITELTDWSWRYSCAGAVGVGNYYKFDSALPSVTIKIGLNNEVIFYNTRDVSCWLDGDSWCDNLFKTESK